MKWGMLATQAMLALLLLIGICMFGCTYSMWFNPGIGG
jgi:hypothetical protein